MFWFRKKEKEAPIRSASYNHFHSFQPGQKAMFLGKEVTVTERDEEWVWDSTHFRPTLVVSWWDGNVLREETLSPARVHSLLSHYEAPYGSIDSMPDNSNK